MSEGEREDPFSVGYERETENAVLDLRVIIEKEEEQKRIEEIKKGSERDRLDEEEMALDLRVVVEKTEEKLIEGPVSKENEGSEEVCNEPLDLRLMKGEVESGGEVIKGGDKKGSERNEVVESEKDEMEVEEQKGTRKRVCEDSSGGAKRVKQSVLELSEVANDSSSSSESDSDADSDSEEEARRADEREKRFTEILGEMVRKTGEIVGGQVLENARLINKLQKTVDLLRKELAELREERREQSVRQLERRRAEEENKENRGKFNKDSRSNRNLDSQRWTDRRRTDEMKERENRGGASSSTIVERRNWGENEKQEQKRGWRRERYH